MPLAENNRLAVWASALVSWIALWGCSPEKRPHKAPQVEQPFESMVEVPAGWFSIGCYRLPANREPTKYNHQDQEQNQSDPTQWDTDAGRLFDCVSRSPPGRRWLSAFAIDRFEVTRYEYVDCFRAGFCQHDPYTGAESYYEFYVRGLIPAHVMFEDAEAFCRWRGKRLPTDAEWQKAARGSDERIYPWGDASPSCNQTSDGYRRRDGRDMACDIYTPYPIGKLAGDTSPYGAQDMFGNAHEWVADWGGRSRASLESVDAYRQFRFSRRVVDGQTILEFDWTSLMFRTVSPELINPTIKFTEATSLNEPIKHIAKGSTTWGIPDWRTGEPTPRSSRPHAGFRCVRDLPGPKPPEVTEPKVGDIVLPFREPGYTPPGTPAQKHKRGKK